MDPDQSAALGQRAESAGYRSTLLQQRGIRISRDGKCCWRDNVFIEQL
jgi:hypothetical protein